VSQGAIAHIIAGRRNAGPEMCEGIARAFKLPPEKVFRLAGLLPPARDENPSDEELQHLFDQLSVTEQEDILSWIRLKVEKNKGDKK
jgi:transcriptional regulator with XRE-family HTH domain